MSNGRLEIIFEVEEDPEGGYIAEALVEAIFTQAETLDELRKPKGSGDLPLCR